MVKRVLALLIVLLGVVSTSTAQGDTSSWYFAFNQDNGSLVAYNLSGQSNILIKSGVTGLNPIGIRISSNEALLLLNVDSQFGLYDATSTSITRLVGEDGILQVPLAYTQGAAVMINQYAGQPVYAALFHEGALTPLRNRPFGSRSYARFSRDGRFFRYIGLDENRVISLWNYEVDTGDETRVIDFGTDVPVLRVDTYGERWMQRTALDGGQVSYRMISLDGHVDDLGTFDESQTAGTYHILGEELIAYEAACTNACPFEVRAGDEVQIFQGDSSTFHSLPVARITNNTMLMLSLKDQFYLATPDAPPQFIGSFTRHKNHIFGASFLAVSPDRRWLLTVDDVQSPTEHQVHDISTGEIAATYTFAEEAYLERVDYGVDMLKFSLHDLSEDFLLYNTDGTYKIVHQPPQDELRAYFELLPGHAALYRTARPFTGIYLHDIEAGTETQLLEGAWDHIRMLTLR